MISRALCITYCYFVYCTSPAVSINGPIVFVQPRADIPPWPLHLDAVLVDLTSTRETSNMESPFVPLPFIVAQKSLYRAANSFIFYVSKDPTKGQLTYAVPEQSLDIIKSKGLF